MQEHTVTVAGKTHPLHEPFFVLATQNPVEQEGTYPLPEAQLDRFMFCLMVDYPSSAEAVQILEATTTDAVAQIESVVSGEEIIEFQKVLRKIPTPKVALEYAVRLVEATRPAHPLATPEVKRFVRWALGPRLAGPGHCGQRPERCCRDGSMSRSRTSRRCRCRFSGIAWC